MKAFEHMSQPAPRHHFKSRATQATKAVTSLGLLANKGATSVDKS